MRIQTLARAEVIARIGTWELFPGAPEQDRCSDGLRSLLGLGAGAHLRRDGYFSRCVHPIDRDHVQLAFERALVEGERMKLEHRLIGFDDSTRNVQCQSESEVDEGGTVQRVLVVFSDLTEQGRSDALKVRLLTRLFAAQEEERRRLGIELHDLFGQQLTALSLRLSALSEQATVDPGIVAEMQTIIEQTGRQVHELASDLRPPLLEDLGLGAAVHKALSAATERSGLVLELDAGGLAEERFPAAVERTLYRVVQEAVTNVVKHARATRLSVLLGRVEGGLEAIIEDDGVGIDLESREAQRGLGIAGMRERVSSVGGTLELESRPRGGTTVCVRVPLGRG